jgi:DNA-binding transcriptional MerR regulator
MDEKIYTTAQVAKVIGVHKNTVFYWLKTGKVKEPKRDALFNGRIWTEKDLEELVSIGGKRAKNK